MYSLCRVLRQRTDSIAIPKAQNLSFDFSGNCGNLKCTPPKMLDLKFGGELSLHIYSKRCSKEGTARHSMDVILLR